MDDLNKIIAAVENSTVIQNYQKQWFAAQDAGASQEELDKIHQAAQDYRSKFGYTGNDDGSDFIVIIGDYSATGGKTTTIDDLTKGAAKAAETVKETAAAAANFNIDGDKLLTYGKYALIGLIGLTVIDGLFGRGK